MPTFSGSDIFGIAVSQVGPTPTRRAMRETLPGVKGFRSYNLQGEGPDTQTFVIRGRLVKTTADRIIGAIASAQSMLNRIATLKDNSGTIWRNVQLIAYAPIAPYKVCIIDGSAWYTVEISATLEQASPQRF